MDYREVGRIWSGNADTWTRLARMGYDVYRDQLNTPAFLEMLPDVTGLRGVDLGCGEGYNTRLVAERGARMVALDVAETFVGHARQAEVEAPQGVSCICASAAQLPFADAVFDFAMGTMSLMDMPEQDSALREAYRVVRPGGFLQFSILHPCFTYGTRKWVHDECGERCGVVLGNYYDQQRGAVEEWIFGAASPELKAALPKFRVPRFDHTLGEWLNMIADAGFVLERTVEPVADEETSRRWPDVADTRIVPLSIIFRCRKPGGQARAA